MANDNRKKIYERTWGLRFSFVDGLVLLATSVVTPWLVREIGSMGWLPAFVVLHFFLFCNVFRIRRKPELIWATCFVLLAGFLVTAEQFAATTLMLCQFPLTVVLIVRDIRHPAYHGVFARRLNPRLDQYLSAESATDHHRL